MERGQADEANCEADVCGCFIHSGQEGFAEQVGDIEQDLGELEGPAMGPSGRIPL